jgi:hypothetical protein
MDVSPNESVVRFRHADFLIIETHDEVIFETSEGCILLNSVIDWLETLAAVVGKFDAELCISHTLPGKKQDGIALVGVC